MQSLEKACLSGGWNERHRSGQDFGAERIRAASDTSFLLTGIRQQQQDYSCFRGIKDPQDCVCHDNDDASPASGEAALSCRPLKPGFCYPSKISLLQLNYTLIGKIELDNGFASSTHRLTHIDGPPLHTDPPHEVPDARHPFRC